MILTLMSPKGGTGKTTAAMAIAQTWAARGASVHVIDMDPQGSATKWAYTASMMGDQLTWPVHAAQPHNLASYVPGSVDHTVIDTPPGVPDVIARAVGVATVVLIPTRPSSIDLEQAVVASRQLDGIPHAVLLMAVDRRSSLGTDARELLAHEGVPTLAADTPLRADLQRAYGKVPQQASFWDAIVSEIEILGRK